ncbi:acyl carrier protein [Paracoccus sp. JM45]|uniref:acyl carrier protein n=1 Tax=Paracoccus sp. JM45 TaxID=2283626 RepID=UPI000E6CBFEF|nr:acyl carrier protein [Paracoccus sp. JM45]RJE78551.1 acyl carrier protein [Paracoccus sp. JM45]
MNIEEKIRTLITQNVGGVDGNAIPSDAILLEAGLDSLDTATVLLEVQEEFDITLPEGQENDFDTIAKMTKFVSNLLK